MKLLFLGDSITQGVGASTPEKRYTDLVAKRLGCEVINYGISGTRIARQRETSSNTVWDIDFRTRLTLMESECDRVFVFGGTNDYGHGTLHLGSPDKCDENTFCTQLRMLIDDLIAKYGKEKVTFIIPLRRFCEEPVLCKGANRDELGASFLDYIVSMRKILDEYGIDYIDLYENGFPKPLVNTGDEFTADGLHPNDKGYEFIADKICEYLLTK
jgi:lysophospholipase L1-like esterase